MIVSESELNAMSVLALAHIGDAVFELMVRTRICRSGSLTAGELHRQTVRRVSAGAQAAAAKKLLPVLTDEERTVYRRGRNAHSHAAPKAVTEGEYHAATGLETLFGWLYLRENKTRLRQLFDCIMEGENAAGRNGADGPAP